MRTASIAAAATVLVGVVSPLAGAETFWPQHVPVTAAERAKTRPLVDKVLAAYRSGNHVPLCDVWSERAVREGAGTRARCRSRMARHPHRACRTCTFPGRRVLGAYMTAADRKAGRKTVIWLVLVKGDPTRGRESGFELSFVRERGRWALEQWLQDG